MAIVTPEKVVTSRAIENTKDENALMPLFDQLLLDAKISAKDLTQIACVMGPGGFTTIRVGAAMANALSFAYDIPLGAIHLSGLWKARVGDQDVLWVHSTRKTQLFIRGFGKYEKKWPEATLINIDQLDIKGAPYVGELIPEQQKELQMTEYRVQSEDVLPSFLVGLEYKKEALEPWYGRGID